MPIFIIYDKQMIWPKAYATFDDAVKDVSSYLDEENLRAKADGFYELEKDRPAKIVFHHFTSKDKYGFNGLMVAWNEYEKIAVYVKEMEF